MTPWTVARQNSSPWTSPGKITGVGRHSLLQGVVIPFSLPPGVEPKSPQSPALQADSLLSEPPGQPNITGGLV